MTAGRRVRKEVGERGKFVYGGYVPAGDGGGFCKG